MLKRTTMGGGLEQLRDELGRGTSWLEKEKEETTLRLQEQEATFQVFGKPQILLSHSSSSSSSCADSGLVV